MKKNGEKIFWGLFFILGAIFILVSRMGYFEEIGLLTLFLTVLLAALLIKSIRHIEFTGILFSLAFLAILYDKPLGIEELTPWPVFGAALLGMSTMHFTKTVKQLILQMRAVSITEPPLAPVSNM